MPLLEYRKVFAVGERLVITLSRNWLAFVDIKAGGQVKIAAHRDLLISLPKGEESGLQHLRCQLPVSDVSPVGARYGKSR